MVLLDECLRIPSAVITSSNAVMWLACYREQAREMFMFGYSNYMQHAFPMDDLRPISCGGHNTQGGIANTLIDSLDALMVCCHPTEVGSMPSTLGGNFKDLVSTPSVSCICPSG